ncbi:MAG: universal stress protein [Burkholderiaceae bacterium]
MVQRILVPLDGSDTAQLGLAEAIALAKPLKASLVLMTVVDDAWLVEIATLSNTETLRSEARRFAEELLAQAKASTALHDLQVSTILREVIGARPSEAIVEVARAERCDLIVMGTHGRKGIGRLVLGSEATAVVQASPVPVMLVRIARPPA